MIALARDDDYMYTSFMAEVRDRSLDKEKKVYELIQTLNVPVITFNISNEQKYERQAYIFMFFRKEYLAQLEKSRVF